MSHAHLPTFLLPPFTVPTLCIFSRYFPARVDPELTGDQVQAGPGRPAPLHVHSHVQLGSTYRGGTPPATDRSISLPPSSTSARCSATRICLPT